MRWSWTEASKVPTVNKSPTANIVAIEVPMPRVDGRIVLTIQRQLHHIPKIQRTSMEDVYIHIP
jgi:hypothetical protein